MKEAAGFGDLKFAISGAAPINPDILALFQKLEIPLFEGYGMTENTAGATLNYLGHNKIGSVGKALPDTEIKIANDNYRKSNDEKHVCLCDFHDLRCKSVLATDLSTSIKIANSIRKIKTNIICFDFSY